VESAIFRFTRRVLAFVRVNPAKIFNLPNFVYLERLYLSIVGSASGKPGETGREGGCKKNRKIGEFSFRGILQPTTCISMSIHTHNHTHKSLRRQGHQHRDHHAQADGMPLPHGGGGGPSGTRGAAGRRLRRPLGSRRRLRPQASRYIPGSSPQAPKATFGSVRCACVLVSPLYYKPSVHVYIVHMNIYLCIVRPIESDAIRPRRIKERTGAGSHGKSQQQRQRNGPTLPNQKHTHISGQRCPVHLRNSQDVSLIQRVLVTLVLRLIMNDCFSFDSSVACSEFFRVSLVNRW